MSLISAHVFVLTSPQLGPANVPCNTCPSRPFFTPRKDSMDHAKRPYPEYGMLFFLGSGCPCFLFQSALLKQLVWPLKRLYCLLLLFHVSSCHRQPLLNWCLIYWHHSGILAGSTTELVTKPTSSCGCVSPVKDWLSGHIEYGLCWGDSVEYHTSRTKRLRPCSMDAYF